MISIHWHKKYSQSGRSMTEMLGVLAIIGVLSIGGIMGYNYAIIKHQANQTLKDLNQFVVLATQQILVGRDTIDLSEANNKTTLGYPATAYLLEDPKYFEIALANVPIAVCKQILNENLKDPLTIKVNTYAYVGDTSICEIDDDETPAEMTFQYAADLDSEELPYGTCKTDSDCQGDCVQCNEEGLCVSRCVSGERCSIDKETGAKVCCPSDKRSGPYCCPSAVNGWCCDENKQNCCPWFKPLRDKNGTCYACDYEASVDVTGVQSNCNVCSNRELDGNKCVLSCPEETPVRDNNGKCRSCYDEEAFNYNRVTLLAKKCVEKCPNRVLNGVIDSICSYDLCGQGIFKDKPLTDTAGKCYSCDEEKNINVNGVTHEGCEQCKNRYLTDVNGFCVLGCSEGEFRDKSGICQSCQDEKPYYYGTTESYACVAMCPNRVLNGWSNIVCSYDLCGQGIFKDKPLTDAFGNCHSCDEEASINVTGVTHEGCDMCKNRYVPEGTSQCILDCPNGQFRDKNGVCQSCQDESSYYFGNNAATGCVQKCSNRVLNGYLDTVCSYDLCGQGIFKDNPLTDKEGKCHACDEIENIYMAGVTHEGCNQCPDERNQYNDYCVLKCPDEMPLLGSNGECYPCDTEEKVDVRGITDVCMECPNERQLDGNYCVLK